MQVSSLLPEAPGGRLCDTGCWSRRALGLIHWDLNPVDAVPLGLGACLYFVFPSGASSPPASFDPHMVMVMESSSKKVPLVLICC